MEQYIIVTSLIFLIFLIGFGLGRISMFKALVNLRKEFDELRKEILIFKHNIPTKKGRIFIKDDDK
jgi:hypothetical protein